MLLCVLLLVLTSSIVGSVSESTKPRTVVIVCGGPEGKAAATTAESHGGSGRKELCACLRVLPKGR